MILLFSFFRAEKCWIYGLLCAWHEKTFFWSDCHQKKIHHVIENLPNQFQGDQWCIATPTNRSVIANANVIRIHLHWWKYEAVVKGRDSRREVVVVEGEEVREEEDVDNIGGDDY